MNKQLADNLQKSLSISQEQIVREEYEMIILKQLFESELGGLFVFKGGTALRLAYGSPRFSEDLDFSILKGFSTEKLDSLLKAVARQYDALRLIDLTQKYYTYFGLFRVKEDFMSQAFSIKFEVSVRPVNLEKGIDYKLLALNSKVTSLTVLAQVASLEYMEKEKKAIEPLRIRDIFDLWFIGQKLGKSTLMNFDNLNAEVVRRELFKFLPEKDKRLVEQWLPKK
ncbi:MAG: nucleotidyl transferase AbiEii/AbiGii toxin family protein [Actinobacteria bacterium]|nr:nucleotidyl transferase AbiEii/AbiGii toxin family protein [Actinomycetota bacterium]